MIKSFSGTRRAGIAALVTTLFVGMSPGGAAQAQPGFDFARLAGSDRYATAATIADRFEQLQAVSDVVLASGQQGRWADALSANFLSGTKNAPVLLTTEKSVPADTMAQLRQFGTDTKVWVVGGSGVISDAQLTQLRNDGYTVQRVAGPARWDTNAAVIKTGGQSKDGLGIVASGLRFPDALAGGPLSYADGMPLGLTMLDDIPDNVVQALKDAGVDRVLVVGGTGVVSQTVVAELASKGITLEKRLWGADRAATSVAVAKYAVANGFDETALNAASGYEAGEGADALAGGPLSGEQQRPVLITVNGERAGQPVLDYLGDNCTTIKDGSLFGGVGALSGALEKEMEAAASCETDPSTGAPDLVDVEFVRTTSTGLTMRYVFDEEVTTNIDAERFQLVGFDSEERIEAGNTVVRESGNTDSVLVVFNGVTADEYAGYSLATVDFTAVKDADGHGNPEGDAALNAGQPGTPGRTAAPDLLSVQNFRAGAPASQGAEPTTTLADFVFDENAHVIDPDRFELVLTNGTTVACEAVANEATEQDFTDYEGDGTTTITVECPNLTGNVAITGNDVARGVALEDAVSDAAQLPLFVPGTTPTATASGNRNAQQASDAPDVASAGPDLDSAAVGVPEVATIGGASTDVLCVTYTLDEPVSNATNARDAAKYFVYNAEGAQSQGDVLCQSERSESATAGDADVVVGFELGDSGDEAAVDADDVAGAGLLTGAAQDAVGNQARDDEEGVSSAAVAAGRTTGPDLASVQRATTQTNTDPLTGETTTTQVTVGYTFDEAVTALNDADSFYVYDEQGNRFELNTCYAGSDATNDTGDAYDDNQVFCRVNAAADGDVTGPSGTSFDTAAERFKAVQGSVLGTVDDASVTDFAANPNPEGAAAIN